MIILDTLSAAQVCAALEHFVDRLRGVAIDARLATGFVWGAILGMMAAGVLYLKLNARSGIPWYMDLIIDIIYH